MKNRCFLDSAAPGGEPVPNPWRKRPPLPAALADLAGCTVILPGGGTPGLSWPAAGFGALAAQASRRGLPVAVAGTKAERKTAENRKTCLFFRRKQVILFQLYGEESPASA